MARIAARLIALLLAVTPAVFAQDSTSGGSASPRFEFGTGAGLYADQGTRFYEGATVGVRAGFRISRSWSVEGLVDFSPEAQFKAGVYRVQARWLIGDHPVQPFLTFGAGNGFIQYNYPEYHWTDIEGRTQVIPARSGLHIDAPIYPVAGFGVEKIVSAHLAVRAELAVAFGISDYGISTAWLPSVGVSIPLGRYRTSR